MDYYCSKSLPCLALFDFFFIVMRYDDFMHMLNNLILCDVFTIIFWRMLFFFFLKKPAEIVLMFFLKFSIKINQLQLAFITTLVQCVISFQSRESEREKSHNEQRTKVVFMFDQNKWLPYELVNGRYNAFCTMFSLRFTERWSDLYRHSGENCIELERERESKSDRDTEKRTL